MAVESYPDRLEPEDQNAVIWRFMSMGKFRNLIETVELYFCRADLFDNDKREGLPLEEYLPALRLNPLDVFDRQKLEHHIGSVAQDREGFYISCWHLFREETCQMWKKYGEDGVGICSRYSLLKSALDAMSDRAFLGLVRYGWEQLTGLDALRSLLLGSYCVLSPPNESSTATSKRSGQCCGLLIHLQAVTGISMLTVGHIQSLHPRLTVY
jgi:hypothetical protein